MWATRTVSAPSRHHDYHKYSYVTICVEDNKNNFTFNYEVKFNLTARDNSLEQYQKFKSTLDQIFLKFYTAIIEESIYCNVIMLIYAEITIQS